MLNHKDMLELSKSYTLKKHNMGNVLIGEIQNGKVLNKVNKNFSNMSNPEINRYLNVVKSVLHSEVGTDLNEVAIKKKDSMLLLQGLLSGELKQHGLNDLLFGLMIRNLVDKKSHFGVVVLNGYYDVPVDTGYAYTPTLYTDREIGETYNYIICGIFSFDEHHLPKKIEQGFLYPAFSNRSSDPLSFDILDLKGKTQFVKLSNIIC